MWTIPEADNYRVRALRAAAVGAVACALVAGLLLRHPMGVALLDRLGVTLYQWHSPLPYHTLGRAAMAGAIGGLLVYLLVLAARFRRPPRTNGGAAPVLAHPVATPSIVADAFWFAVNAALAAIAGAASGGALALLLIIHQPLYSLKLDFRILAEWLRGGAVAGTAAGLLCGVLRVWPFRLILGAMVFSAACGLAALGLTWTVLDFYEAKSWSVVGVIAGAVAGAVICPNWVRANGRQ
jgi:hypothetical protein